MYRLGLFRSIIAFNLILIALSWSPWFEGTEAKIGAVDRLIGSFRLGGFRADLIWLVVSTAGILLALIPFLMEARRNRTARLNALLCVVEILAFCSFVYRILTTGVLDFG
jgi:hypothetical protein